jgi:hypothetical protein
LKIIEQVEKMKKPGLYFCLIIFLLSCGDKKAETVSELPKNYRSRFMPKKVVQQAEESFALTLNVKDSLFVIGDRDKGKNIFLLNNETGDYCQAQTGEPQIYFEEISDVHWQLTPILPQPSRNSRYDLAFAHPEHINFQLIGNTTIRDPILIADIDKEIKLSGFIDTLLAYDDKPPTDSVVGMYKPKITKINFPGEDAYVVTYSYVDSIPGPRMLILNNNIFPLTGPCSYQHVYPFRINGRNFIQTGSSCCECGWVIDQVFEIIGDQVVLAFQDDSYSE